MTEDARQGHPALVEARQLRIAYPRLSAALRLLAGFTIVTEPARLA